MKLENIIVLLRMKEDSRKFEKMSSAFHLMESKANKVEGNSKVNEKRKHDFKGQIGSSNASKKFEVIVITVESGTSIQRFLKIKEC